MSVDHRSFVPQPFDDDSEEGIEARQLQGDLELAQDAERPSLYERSQWFSGLGQGKAQYDGEELDRQWQGLMEAMPHEHELLERLDTGSIAATSAAVWAGEHGDAGRARRYAHLALNYNLGLHDLGIDPAYPGKVNTSQYLRE